MPWGRSAHRLSSAAVEAESQTTSQGGSIFRVGCIGGSSYRLLVGVAAACPRRFRSKGNRGRRWVTTTRGTPRSGGRAQGLLPEGDQLLALPGSGSRPPGRWRCFGFGVGGGQGSDHVHAPSLGVGGGQAGVRARLVEEVEVQECCKHIILRDVNGPSIASATAVSKASWAWDSHVGWAL